MIYLAHPAEPEQAGDFLVPKTHPSRNRHNVGQIIVPDRGSAG